MELTTLSHREANNVLKSYFSGLNCPISARIVNSASKKPLSRKYISITPKNGAVFSQGILDAITQHIYGHDYQNPKGNISPRLIALVGGEWESFLNKNSSEINY